MTPSMNHKTMSNLHTSPCACLECIAMIHKTHVAVTVHHFFCEAHSLLIEINYPIILHPNIYIYILEKKKFAFVWGKPKMQIDYQTHELGVSIPWYEYRKTPTRILMIVGQGGSIISSFHKKKSVEKKVPPLIISRRKREMVKKSHLYHFTKTNVEKKNVPPLSQHASTTVSTGRQLTLRCLRIRLNHPPVSVLIPRKKRGYRL